MLNFTRQERMVVYFLIITLGIGAVIKYVRNQRFDDQLRPHRFYEEEQRFQDISAQINADSTVLIDSSYLDATSAVDVSTAESELEISGSVNLNTASVEALSTLPGIGPAIANRIKAYTELNGPFENKEEIVLVKGIGKKIYARIEGLVTTE